MSPQRWWLALTLLIGGAVVACTLNPQPHPPGDDFSGPADAGRNGEDSSVSFPDAAPPTTDAGQADASIDAGADVRTNDSGADASDSAADASDAESDGALDALGE